jgi:hypothetical protein
MSILETYKKEIEQLCKEHQVQRLHAFGSVLGNDFTDSSDIDFLVQFQDIDLKSYFENYMNFKQELINLFNRDIDLLEEQTLKNPYLISNIESNKALLYG